MLQYILECIAFQLVFLIIYDLFLKRETFFQWNRLYLIGTYIISMVLPWIKIEAMKTTVPESFQAYPEFLWNLNDTVVTATAVEETSFNISWEYALLFGGMFLAALFFGYKLFQIFSLRRKGKVHYFKDFTQIIVSNSSIAFSFFKSIFLGDQVIAKEHQNILQHELVHIRQRHSYDLIFFELMRIVGWFNPLVYVYQSRVSELHEFIADAQVAKTSKKEHYQMLLSEVFQTQNISFINQFFKSSLIKKRIVMLTKQKSKQVFKLKYVLLIPVLFGILFYNSCKEIEKIENDSAIVVDNIEDLTLNEEVILFDTLKELIENEDDWVLYVKDNNSSIKFVEATDGSFISGPNREKVNAKMVIENKFQSYNKVENFESVFVKMERVGEEHNRLIKERLDISMNTFDQNPRILELDKKIRQLNGNSSIGGTNETPFYLISRVPIFPGCEDSENSRACFQESLMKHIRKNFNYPKKAEEQSLEGEVVVKFKIDELGKVANISSDGPYELLEDEASRIINTLPKMTPGSQGGEDFGANFTIPITFKLKG